jgi:hypothetical protein
VVVCSVCILEGWSWGGRVVETAAAEIRDDSICGTLLVWSQWGNLIIGITILCGDFYRSWSSHHRITASGDVCTWRCNSYKHCSKTKSYLY